MSGFYRVCYPLGAVQLFAPSVIVSVFLCVSYPLPFSALDPFDFRYSEVYPVLGQGTTLGKGLYKRLFRRIGGEDNS